MSDMTQSSFKEACDALSGKIDAEQFERFRWTRDEAPKLARLVELVRGSVEDRTDIEINEEGGTAEAKRFVIKVHGKRVAGLGVALDRGHAVISIGAIERSPYPVAQERPIHAPFSEVDEQWIGNTLASLMQRIGRAPGSEGSDTARTPG